MSESNFSFLSGGLAAASVSRGVTSAFTRPASGGSFIFGFSSLDAAEGVVGLYVNSTNFSPLLNDASNPTGGSIRGAIKRATSAGPTDFAPFLFIGQQGLTVSDSAYMLGLSDNDPHEIILRKGASSGGLKPTAAGILRKGSETFTPDTWLHLRLDMIVNPNGDVILKVFRSDLAVNPVTAPVWAAVPGMADYTDDALSINSGSAPLQGGRVGFGFHTKALSRRGFVDQLEVSRQR